MPSMWKRFLEQTEPQETCDEHTCKPEICLRDMSQDVQPGRTSSETSEAMSPAVTCS